MLTVENTMNFNLPKSFSSQSTREKEFKSNQGSTFDHNLIAILSKALRYYVLKYIKSYLFAADAKPLLLTFQPTQNRSVSAVPTVKNSSEYEIKAEPLTERYVSFTRIRQPNRFGCVTNALRFRFDQLLVEYQK